MLTAMQQYALCVQICSDPEYAKRWYFSNEAIRKLEFNAQRSLHDASDKLYRERFGMTAYEIVKAINDAHDTEVIRRARQ